MWTITEHFLLSTEFLCACSLAGTPFGSVYFETFASLIMFEMAEDLNLSYSE